MVEFALIQDLAVVWLAALVVGCLCRVARLPLIAGYIVAGVLLGPHGLALISKAENIRDLAEFGVALLLFSLGVELSLRHVFASAGRALVAGFSQVIFTVLAGSCYVVGCGISSGLASTLVFGVICALSSTAIVSKVLLDRGEVESAHGRVLIPTLILQDLLVIPVVALLPALSASGGANGALLLSLGKAALLVVLVLLGAVFWIPRLLVWVAAANSRELFTLTVMSLCVGVALAGHALGVSLALGAFLAGIMVSERPFGHQVLSDVLPMRDLFSTVFFVSIGMLLNPQFFATHTFEVLGFVAFVLLGKAIIAGASALAAVRSTWTAALVGVSLAQIGEFSFIVATLAHDSGVLGLELYNLFLSGAVLSLVLSPALIAILPGLLSRVPWFRLSRRQVAESGIPSGLARHAVVLGFGRIGRQLGAVLESFQIPFLVVDMNVAVVQDLDRRGIPHIYGDALSRHVLLKARLHDAASVAVTVPDPVVAASIISFARKENPEVQIIARAHHAEDVELLRAAGANAVVQPEFEASVELTRMTLLAMERSAEEIRRALKEIRQRGYMLFKPDFLPSSFIELPHEDCFGVWYVFEGPVRTLEDLHVRRRTGATVLAIRRSDDLVAHPDGSESVLTEDQLYVAGNDEQLSRFEESFQVRRFCPMTERTSSELETGPEAAL